MLEIPDENPSEYLDMPEGLSGYWWETDNQICVPVVMAKNEGDGTFSRWLTELEAKGKVVFFPTIVSARLDAILRGRGYVDAVAKDKVFGFVDGLAKKC